eukprot:3398063-Heterocapsa_arctica.AAC.1
MKGKAFAKPTLSDGSIKQFAFPSNAVWVWRGLAPNVIEATIVRLEQLQQVLSDPSHHNMSLTLFFGHLRLCGHPAPLDHPWLWQLADDPRRCIDLEEMQYYIDLT